MKNRNLIYMFFIGVISLISCEETVNEPVLDLTKAVGPELTTPATDGTYLFTKETEDDVFTTFTWTEADYMMAVSISYSVEMDLSGGDFEEATVVASSDSLSASITVSEINGMLALMGVEPEIETSIDFRVVSTINDNVEDLASSVISLNITSFSDAAPPLYLLGGGTLVGWDNMLALPFEHVEDGVYRIVTDLNPSSGMKVLTTLGQWAPQYGSDGTGDWASGKLSFRPTEDVADPAEIPTPPDAGTYEFTVDIVNLTYSTKASSR